jgi:hypothetical protein
MAVFHNAHGAEFENVDSRLKAAAAALAEKNRAVAFKFDGDGNDRPKRRGDDQDCRTNRNIFETLSDWCPIG